MIFVYPSLSEFVFHCYLLRPSFSQFIRFKDFHWTTTYRWKKFGVYNLRVWVSWDTSQLPVYRDKIWLLFHSEGDIRDQTNQWTNHTSGKTKIHKHNQYRYSRDYTVAYYRQYSNHLWFLLGFQVIYQISISVCVVVIVVVGNEWIDEILSLGYLNKAMLHIIHLL